MSEPNDDLAGSVAQYDSESWMFAKLAVICMMILLLMAGTAAVYYAQKPAPKDGACVQSEAINKAALESQKRQLDIQEAQLKRDTDLKLKLMESCIGHSGVPILSNNNVDCKAMPK